jgi:hypothetical protein
MSIVDSAVAIQVSVVRRLDRRAYSGSLLPRARDSKLKMLCVIPGLRGRASLASDQRDLYHLLEKRGFPRTPTVVFEQQSGVNT